MNKQRCCWTLFFLFALSNLLHAGSRGVAFSFLDATTGQRSAASLRLAELLEKDMRSLYVDPQFTTTFPWTEQDLKLQTLTSKKTKITFDPLLNTKDHNRIEALCQHSEATDGLIVFFHDQAGGYARLKLYNADGKEALLLRLPLEKKDSAMPNSLLKAHRRGALIAIGASLHWNP